MDITTCGHPIILTESKAEVVTADRDAYRGCCFIVPYCTRTDWHKKHTRLVLDLIKIWAHCDWSFVFLTPFNRLDKLIQSYVQQQEL